MGMPENRIYGWRPSLPDVRDEDANLTGLATPPVEYDPRSEFAPVYDQGQLGSCTGNAVAGALQYHWGVDWVPSRLYIYYFERKVEHQLGQGDTGAYGRDGFKIARKRGVPPETLWPYDISRFEERPNQTVIDAGRRYLLEQRFKVVPQDEASVKAVLANKQTIAFGFTVYESFESQAVADTGRMPLPRAGERILGGHEVLAVGYNANGVICRNSWGRNWGLNGYFIMPWGYFLHSRLTSDHRTIVRPA